MPEGTIFESNVGVSKKYVMSGEPENQPADQTKVRRDIRFVDILEVTRADLNSWMSGAKLKAKGYSLKSRKFFKFGNRERGIVQQDIDEALGKYAGASQLHRGKKVKSGKSEIGTAASKRTYSEVDVDPIVLVYDKRWATKADQDMIRAFAEEYSATAKAERGWTGTFEVQFL